MRRSMGGHEVECEEHTGSPQYNRRENQLSIKEWKMVGSPQFMRRGTSTLEHTTLGRCSRKEGEWEHEEEHEEEREEEREEEHEEEREEHEECQGVAALQPQRRGVSTHEERRVEGSLQYNCREDEWGVSTVRHVKERAVQIIQEPELRQWNQIHL